jgi:6-pyruvoyltetrahydropterin/6-carboxytetrahydropterin synthase
MFRFSAAHRLPYHHGKCANAHGHNYAVEVTATGVVHPTDPFDSESGMVKDFYNITKDAIKVILKYDHTDLNEAFPNPTAEVLALVWLTQLRELDPWYTKVTVWETDDCYAIAEVSSK